MSTSASAAKPKRLVWVDYIKGMSITSVVIYHVIIGLETAGLLERGIHMHVFSEFLSITGMPMFFFMTGMFVVRGAYRDKHIFLVEKIKTLIYPYFLWICIYASIQYVAGSAVNNPLDVNNLWRAIYMPPWHYWFMYVLFLYCVIYTVAAYFRIPPMVMLVAGLALHVFFHFLPLGSWGVGYMSARWFIFFALGAVVNGRGPVLWFSDKDSRFLLCTAAVTLPIAVGALYLRVERVPPTQILLFIPGGLFMLSSAILMRRHRALRFLEHIGRRSMAVYVAHVIPLAAMRIILLKLGMDGVVVHMLLGTLAGVLAPMWLSDFAMRHNMYWLFTLKKPKTPTPERAPVPSESRA